MMSRINKIFTLLSTATLFFSGCAYNNGIDQYQSSDPDWVMVGAGLPVTAAPFFKLLPCGNNLVLLAQGGGIYYSGNEGNTWTKSTIPDTVSASWMTSVGTTLFVNSGSGLWRSLDYGVSWEAVPGTALMGRLGATVTGSMLFSFTDSIIYSSSNNGKSWTATNYMLPDSLPIQELFYYNGSIYASSFNAGFYRSPANPISWTIVKSANGLSSSIYSMIGSGNSVYIATGLGVFRSTDNGVSFSSTTLVQGCHDLAFYNSYLFATNLRGQIFYSSDNGATWRLTGGGLINTTGLAAHNSYLFSYGISEIWRMQPNY
jgi:hypothetical protein